MGSEPRGHDPEFNIGVLCKAGGMRLREGLALVFNQLIVPSLEIKA